MHTPGAQIDNPKYPMYLFVCIFLYKGIHNVEYIHVYMHTPGAQGSKSMHPPAKMCTPGAGTLSLFSRTTQWVFCVQSQ